MKHASAETLRHIEHLLVEVRACVGLVERKPGVFYFRSRAFLHFHEDPSGVFADVRVSDSFERINVDSRTGQAHLLSMIRRALE